MKVRRPWPKQQVEMSLTVEVLPRFERKEGLLLLLQCLIGAIAVVV